FTPLAAVTLCARGITTPEAADAFLNPPGLHDPRLLTDMDVAVEVIQAAVASGKKIVVFGDYDVDGITATCVLTDYLRSAGAACSYYIPDRLSEGYGLNCAAVDRFHTLSNINRYIKHYLRNTPIQKKLQLLLLAAEPCLIIGRWFVY
ncbi:hypothetical protein D7X33_27280, partial [Butyricicoccus sp. 1XD8-22]